METTEFIVTGLAFVGLIILVAALLTFPTYFLWNWLMPDIFNLPKVSVLQALGLNLLSGVLFGSVRSKKD